ncbi:Abi family protein [Thiothrix sp.]|jgi:abortive infection bacteriophage resistance protein|uniref:Abi family protein n=1 Tax=Thiothrix sp. TaxID=1032 RepID=UPI00257CFE09|nr:Abi family protein [Thiothrix sp.]
MIYDKPPLSFADQAQRLRERGLSFDDPAHVEHYLSHIGYYRLSAYWLPFELPSSDGITRCHQFQVGTTFEQILQLYIFDRKLRLLAMEAIERIEVALRTRWAGSMSLRHGSHAHMKHELFKCPWNHARDLGKMVNELHESKETFIVHYRDRYTEPFLPPIWAVVETLTLGALSRWLKNTKDMVVKKEIMRSFGMPTVEIMEGVFHALTPIRNVCAHHSRLWNRRFAMSLPYIQRMRHTMQPPNAPNHAEHHLYNYLSLINVLMKAINPGSSWKTRLIELLNTINPAQQQAMGFPTDWKTRPFWAE